MKKNLASKSLIQVTLIITKVLTIKRLIKVKHRKYQELTTLSNTPGLVVSTGDSISGPYTLIVSLKSPKSKWKDSKKKEQRRAKL